ncbi:transporter [Trinickia mobilis]|uniref:transporter n=1 Tax=Trinickia mobilis TaxID=2816356 RepID=UPI001A8CAD3C|nr:transporter [Trinickia mobilis]
MKIKSILKPLAAILACFALFAAMPARAIDIDAGDYEAAPPGTNVGLLYLQHASRNALYSGGNKIAGNNDLDSDVGILRGVHFTEIGGMTADPQILIPFGRLAAKGDLAGSLGSTNGIGDIILAATFWVQNDPASKVYTGITPYLFLPSGSYDHDKALNLGENRWKYDLQVAHVRRLGENFSLDLVGDVMVFGNNNDFGATSATLKQKPLFQAQAFLRYHLSPTADLRLLASYVTGGETNVNGINQNDRQSTTKFAVGSSFFVGPKTQIIGMLGRDAHVRNGFKEEFRANIRILHLF